MSNKDVGTHEVGAHLPPCVVLYDGVCRVCDSSVNWLIEHDPAARLHFAPLQGSTAAELRKRHPAIPNDVDTIVYVEVAGGTERVYLRSAAILRIYEVVGFDSWSLRWSRRLPHWCADLGYRMFARLRYRLFGKLDVCRVPGQEDERFLP